MEECMKFPHDLNHPFDGIHPEVALLRGVEDYPLVEALVVRTDIREERVIMEGEEFFD